MNRDTKRQGKIRHIERWSAWLFLVLAAAGCGATDVEYRADLRTLAEGLDEIETVQLAKQSEAEPVSIEQATQASAREAAEPNVTQPVMELTLEEVRAAALTNNLDLKVELVEPSIAAQNIDVERAAFEAVFAGSAQYTRTEPADGNASSTRQYFASVEKPLETGGLLAADVPWTNTDGVSDAAVSVSFIQSLLRGAGTRINTYSIQIAMYNKAAVDAGTKLAAIRVLANADIAYWLLYAARKELDVRREQYKLAQNQLRHARLKVEAKSAPRIEIVRAEAGLASRLEDVINAETAVRDRERDLRRIMNRPDMPLNSQVGIVTMTEPDPKGLELDEEKLVAAAMTNRMELARLEFRLAVDDIGVNLARNRLLPELTLDYTYTAGGIARRTGAAFENIFDDPSHGHAVRLSAEIPLGNEAAEARFRQARLAKIRDQADQERLAQFIHQEVYDAADGLEQNWRRILAAEQGVVAAYRDYGVEQSQFQLGVRTSTDVLFAASRLADAQSRRIRAFAEYEIAAVRLAQATGTLLGRDQIRLQAVTLARE